MAERGRPGGRVVQTQRPPAAGALLERAQNFDELALHADPWRVLRILSEFVEGFDALADIGPAITVFGSARVPATDPLYEMGRQMGEALARRRYAVDTRGSPGIL